MPLYEYLCRDCGQPFEKMVRMSDQEQVPVCPACGSADTRKQISTFAAHGFATRPSVSAASSACSSTGRFT